MAPDRQTDTETKTESDRDRDRKELLLWSQGGTEVLREIRWSTCVGTLRKSSLQI